MDIFDRTGYIVASGSAKIGPGSIFIHTEVTGEGSAYCTDGAVQSTDPAPQFGSALVAFAGYLFVDVPFDGTLVFDMQRDGLDVIRMTFPVTSGFQAVMPLSVGTRLDFHNESLEHKIMHAENSVSITGIEIVPEPGSWALTFLGLCVFAPLLRRRVKQSKDESPSLPSISA